MNWRSDDIDRVNLKNSEENVSQIQFIDLKSHMDCSELELGSPWWEIGPEPPELLCGLPRLRSPRCNRVPARSNWICSA